MTPRQLRDSAPDATSQPIPMDDYICDRCGETLAGKFIEVHIEPRFLGVADDATLLAYAETQHLLETRCAGSLVLNR